MYKYLEGLYQEDGARLFSLLPNHRMIGNGPKRQEVLTEHEENFYTVNMPEHWNRLHRVALESPSWRHPKDCIVWTHTIRYKGTLWDTT